MEETLRMIDLHAHILPQLDDGAKTLEESIEMCRMGYKDGIRTIVATPHILKEIYSNDRPTILAEVRKLNEEIREFGLRTPDSGLSLIVLPGADVHFSPHMLQLYEKGEILTVNDKGKHLMVEFDSQGIPFRAEDVLFHLIAGGIIPIITHPERNLEIGNSLQRYGKMIQMGCLGQVTAMSLTGAFGFRVKEIAETLLENRWVHIIASDTHSIHERPPILSSGVKQAAKIVGIEEARRMVTEYPQAILEGRKPDVPEPIHNLS